MFSSDKRHDTWACGSPEECTQLYGSAYTNTGGAIDPPTPVGNIAATIQAPNLSITSNGQIQNVGNVIGTSVSLTGQQLINGITTANTYTPRVNAPSQVISLSPVNLPGLNLSTPRRVGDPLPTAVAGQAAFVDGSLAPSAIGDLGPQDLLNNLPSNLQPGSTLFYYNPQEEDVLLQQAALQQTGKASFIDGLSYDSMSGATVTEQEKAYLYQNAIDYAKANNLQLGDALTQAQVSELDKPMLWYVEQTVPDPDCKATGNATCPTITALMPQVYLPSDTSAMSAGGNSPLYVIAHAGLGCAAGAAEGTGCAGGAIGGTVSAGVNPIINGSGNLSPAALAGIEMLVSGSVAGALGFNVQGAATAAQNETLNNFCEHNSCGAALTAFLNNVSSALNAGADVPVMDAAAGTDVLAGIGNTALNISSGSLPGSDSFVPYFQYNNPALGALGETYATLGLGALALSAFEGALAANTAGTSEGTANAATLQGLKGQLANENLANIAAQDPRLAAAVNGSGTSNINFPIGTGTAAEADTLGQTWVGDGARPINGVPGGLVSADGTRVYRPPTAKPNTPVQYAPTGVQANFQQLENGVVISNGHLNISKP
ncbi:hypothetical protein [Paraburkholderia sp. SOS3]|uniref:hypothetical protein n=1 Tax=Paraburkholderia sp. SOS3 TaxID=1926494 RepID=UPI003FA7A382